MIATVGPTIEVQSRRVAEGVRVIAPDFAPRDDWLLLVPGFPRRIELRPAEAGSGATWRGGRIEAMSGRGGVAIDSADE